MPSADASGKPLLFDVMGTLVHEPFYEEVPAFFGMSLEELIEAKHPKAWLRFETGGIDEATLFETFFLDGRAFDHEGLKACMAEAYRWLEGMEELVADLRETGASLHALSNYSPWYRLIEERLAVSRYVAWSFVSCDTGVRKPDREAYLGPARALGVEPADCVFVDDREANCRAARALGMDAIRFRGAKGLRAELERRGLL